MMFEQEGEVFPVAQLLAAEPIRIQGLNEEHIRVLASCFGELPPILVHHETKRVVDGMHRLRAAELIGLTHVPVEYYYGDQASAFLLSVERNVTHGLPLSLADRKSAASRIIQDHPELSDRAIARISGLSGRTVGNLRRGLTSKTRVAGRRIGRDGRARPIDSRRRREVASQLLTSRPDASLRDIAEVVGLSPNTVRSVRNNLNEEDKPGSPPAARPTPRGDASAAPPALNNETSAARPAPGGEAPEVPAAPSPQRGAESNLDSLLSQVRRDPSLRHTNVGRALLRWLSMRPIIKDFRGFAAALPPHALPAVARLARQQALERAFDL